MSIATYLDYFLLHFYDVSVIFILLPEPTHSLIHVDLVLKAELFCFYKGK